MSRFFFIIWIILLIGISVKAYFHIPFEQVAVSYHCAADSLTVNHQVVAADLERNDGEATSSEYTGKYLLFEKRKGDLVEATDLAINPVMYPVPKDSAVAVVYLRDDELPIFEMTDAGTHVYLIPTLYSDTISQNKDITPPSITPVTLQVIAVHRATKEVAGNWLWVQFSLQSYHTIAAFVASPKRIVTKAPD